MNTDYSRLQTLAACMVCHKGYPPSEMHSVGDDLVCRQCRAEKPVKQSRNKPVSVPLVNGKTPTVTR